MVDSTPWPEAFGQSLETDDELATLAAGASVSFLLTVRGQSSRLISFIGADVTVHEEPSSHEQVAFEVALDLADWTALLSEQPAPRHQHILAFLAPRGTGEVRGDTTAFAQHLQLVRRVVEIARGDARVESSQLPPPLGAVTGRYVRVTTPAWGACDVYYESVGDGIPVVLLATAGSDGRQFHGLMTDAELTAACQLIAVDLPWHGKSDPPYGATGPAYSLDSDSYSAFVAAFISALELRQKPVVVGASMAGAAVVELAARYPDSTAGVVGCQAGPRVANRHTPWLRSPTVNQTLHVPEWTYGLMSPASPKGYRDRVWWGYSQGGFGTYERDITYYTTSWDIDRVSGLFSERTPPVVLMSGVYDYTVPPEATRALAEQIPGAVFREMPELGHFPHAENPPAFAKHLRWALNQLGVLD